MHYSIPSLDSFNGLPAPDHIETIFQGVIDTVTGNEGFTYSQVYLHAAMGADGSLSTRTGVEGFFSALGNGLAKVWEYIKKMFSWIFGGTFKKEADEKVKEVKKDIKTTGQKLDKAKSTKVTEEQVDGLISKSITATSHLPDSPVKTKLTAQLKAVHEEKDKKKRVIDFSGLAEEVFDAEVLNNHKLVTFDKKVSVSVEKLKKMQKEIEGEKDSLMVPETILKDFLSALEALPSSDAVKDYSSAKQYISKLEHTLDTTDHILTNIESSKGGYSSRLQKVESEMNHADADKADLTKQIEKLKKAIARLVTMLQLITGVIGGIEGCVGIVDKAIVVVI